MVVAYILIVLTGCTSMTTNQRDSLLADVRAAQRAVKQSAKELDEIIEVKDRDVKKFAPAYAQVYNKTTDDLTATLDSSNQVTNKAKGYIGDLYGAANILEDVEYDLLR